MKIKLFTSEDLNFVEFSLSSGRRQFKPHTDRSRYLNSAVFSLFQHAFELGRPDFHYYQPTPYRGPEIVRLRNHLVDQISMIGRVLSAEDLEAFALKQLEGIDFLNEMKTDYPNWKIGWENARDQLRGVLDELLEMVDYCIDEDKIFWVKGY